MFDHRRYRRYQLHAGCYLALPLEAFIAYQYFTGALPSLLAIAYSIALAVWFVLG